MAKKVCLNILIIRQIKFDRLTLDMSIYYW